MGIYKGILEGFFEFQGHKPKSDCLEPSLNFQEGCEGAKVIKACWDRA